MSQLEKLSEKSMCFNEMEYTIGGGAEKTRWECSETTNGATCGDVSYTIADDKGNVIRGWSVPLDCPEPIQT